MQNWESYFKKTNGLFYCFFHKRNKFFSFSNLWKRCIDDSFLCFCVFISACCLVYYVDMYGRFLFCHSLRKKHYISWFKAFLSSFVRRDNAPCYLDEFYICTIFHFSFLPNKEKWTYRFGWDFSVSAMLVRLLAMVNLCLVFPHVKHYICSPAQRQPWSALQCSCSVSICNTVRTASLFYYMRT